MHNQLVHDGQRQRRIGARQQRDVFVAFFGRFAFARVDAHQARTVALGLLRDAPEVQIAAYRVAAPNEDQFGLGKVLHFHAQLAAEGVSQALGTGGGADGAVQQ